MGATQSRWQQHKTIVLDYFTRLGLHAADACQGDRPHAWAATSNIHSFFACCALTTLPRQGMMTSSPAARRVRRYSSSEDSLEVTGRQLLRYSCRTRITCNVAPAQRLVLLYVGNKVNSFVSAGSTSGDKRIDVKLHKAHLKLGKIVPVDLSSRAKKKLVR